MRFAQPTGVRPLIDKFQLAKVNEAYARTTSGTAQFRVVLTIEEILAKRLEILMSWLWRRGVGRD